MNAQNLNNRPDENNENDEQKNDPAAIGVNAEYYDTKVPCCQLLIGRERRVIILLEWNDYVIDRKIIRGLVSVDPNYGNMPAYLGFVQVSGKITISLPPNLVNTMIAWWEHRRGGKTEENFDISVIYFDQIFSNVSMSSESYMIVRKWVPIIAYIQLSDIDARLMRVDHSWSQYLFKTVKHINKNKTIYGCLFMTTMFGFKFKRYLNGK